ncbi:hypothetical protein AB0B45_21100 [Nonomuraea sp. NPDC049152]|uniref:hypothetical protein n=1 Tax=Nonomuraea sp. NPDC049152 TaxID=3154350 RepID=UPI0033F3ECF8
MNDPYHLDPSGRPTAPASGRRGGGVALRALLWVVFIVSAATNIVGNTIGGTSTLVGMGAGIIAVGCIAGLITHHFVARRRA